MINCHFVLDGCNLSITEREANLSEVYYGLCREIGIENA